MKLYNFLKEWLKNYEEWQGIKEQEK